MAFRHRKFQKTPLTNCVPFETLVCRPVSQSDGSVIYSTVALDDASLNGSLPSPSDYTLEKLLNANVPLQRVDISLDNTPTDENISNFVNNNLKIEDNEN